MMLARKPDELSACYHRPVLSRALWLVWLWVALMFGVFAGHGWAREFEPVSVRLEPVQVSPRVWYVMGDTGPVSVANEGFNSNAGFVITDEGIVVFDALGSPALGAVLLQRIQQLTAQPVRRVIVSHYHADHFYGLQAFKAQGAEIWAHRRALEYLASDAPRLRLDERRQSLFPWVNEFTRIVPPDVVIDSDREFMLGGVRFQLFSAGPAHTPEDLMMLVPDEKVLFAGDLIFAGRVPFVGDADSRAWLGALDRLVEQAPSIVVTGHGPHSQSGLNDVTLTRDYLRHLRAEMGRGVEQMLTFEEAYAAADWSRFRHLPAFSAANRGNAFNTFILMEREALSRP